MALPRVPWRVWPPLVLAAAVLVVSTSMLFPGPRARAKAGATLVEALGGTFPRPFAPEVRRIRDVAVGGVTGDLYDPGRPSPAMLFVPGAAPEGRDDPRAVRAARAIARAGRLVFVPELILYERRFAEEDLDRLVRASLGLDGYRAASGPLSVVGISYGGSFALIAAADPRLEGRLGQVAVFGAYYDLVGVIQAVTTRVSLVEGVPYRWEPHPAADRLLRENAVMLAPEGSRSSLRAALRGEIEPGDLDPQARALHDLLTNGDPARTFELAARLPPEIRRRLARFSPSSVAGRIRAPVVALHSTADPAVPFGEAVRLARGIPGVRLVTVGGFQHVDFGAPSGWIDAAADLSRVWRFATWVIGSQE